MWEIPLCQGLLYISRHGLIVTKLDYALLY